MALARIHFEVRSVGLRKFVDNARQAGEFWGVDLIRWDERKQVGFGKIGCHEPPTGDECLPEATRRSMKSRNQIAVPKATRRRRCGGFSFLDWRCVIASLATEFTELQILDS